MDMLANNAEKRLIVYHDLSVNSVDLRNFFLRRSPTELLLSIRYGRERKRVDLAASTTFNDFAGSQRPRVISFSRSV
ncbi:hypothetical protein BaRGS_00007544 [Batillaria attramentaria]|uniref:Uncharacterized protein n=1 Tax=Batillaria attramentaria TaxID=370345 RepID=A0ABD0LNN0_9CAEN